MALRKESVFSCDVEELRMLEILKMKTEISSNATLDFPDKPI